MHRPAPMVVLGFLFLAIGCGKSEPDAIPTPSAPAEQKSAAPSTGDEKPTPPGPPATLKQALAVVDLSTLPVPDGAIYMTRSPVLSHYTLAKGDINKAVDLYRSRLSEMGWKPSPEAGLTVINKHGGQLVFVKQGFFLYAAIGVSPADGNLNAVLFHVGNVDARTLPRPAGADVSTSSTPQRIIYATNLKLDDVKKYLREEMKKAGWREAQRPAIKGVPPEKSGQDKELYFLIAGIKNEILLVPEDDKVQVYSTVGMLQEQLPIPPEAIGLEFEEQPLSLYYYTKTDLDAVVKYCQKELADMGWKLREGAGKVADKAATLAFDSPGREPLRLECLRAKDAPITIVRFTRWPKEMK